MKIVAQKGINPYCHWLKDCLRLHSLSSIQVMPKTEELYDI